MPTSNRYDGSEDAVTTRSTPRRRSINTQTEMLQKERAGSLAPRTTAPQPLHIHERRGQRTTGSVRATTPTAVKTTWKQNKMLFLGGGMLIALSLVLISQQIMGAFTLVWNDLHYGRPRTFQTDVFVGHETGNTPSHFIALNDHGRIEIIEFPGGDASHARIFIGPQLAGPNADLEPVTLRFVDIHKNKHPDMIAQTPIIDVTFHNVQNTFQAT